MSDKYIQTSTGNYFDFLNPENYKYDIDEIAHALSHICRYTGHVREFYSVAQHSVMVSLIVPPKYALEGLLHDASEAYLGDVSTNLKFLLNEYKILEAEVEASIAMQYNIPFPMSEAVKAMDIKMLVTEKRDLMPNNLMDIGKWPDTTPLDMKIEPWSSGLAKEMFLARYKELTFE